MAPVWSSAGPAPGLRVGLAVTPDTALTPDTWRRLQPKPALDVSTVVLLAQSAEDTFTRCVEQALRMTRATTSLVLLRRPELDVLEVVAGAGHLGDAARGRRLGRGRALAWRVIDSGERQLIRQAELQPDATYLSGTPAPGMYLGVPLIDPDGVVLGVLTADTTGSAEELTEADAEVLLLLGQAAGVAYSRWQALERAQRSARQFELLARLSARLEHLTDPAPITLEGLRTLMELSGFSVGAAVRLDAHGCVTLTVLEGRGPHRASVAAALGTPHAPRGVIAQVLDTDRSVAVPEEGALPGVPAVRAAVAAPLRSGGHAVGVITLLQLDPAQPDGHAAIPDGLMTLLDAVAARIDRATERAAGVEHLQQTREAALRSMGRVIEGRDGETFGHTDRVTTLAVRLGHALKLDATAMQHLRWGAYLHDIGKVTLPDAVLLKPGPLTPEERERMQQHVVTGDDLLRDEIFVPREVRAVVRSHHERWDGRGYPDGLSGERIPLLARMFSVVDVYDALVSERPYKRAWPHEDALAELRRSAGTQFDPAIVEAFLALPPDDGSGA